MVGLHWPLLSRWSESLGRDRTGGQECPANSVRLSDIDQAGILRSVDQASLPSSISSTPFRCPHRDNDCFPTDSGSWRSSSHNQCRAAFPSVSHSSLILRCQANLNEQYNSRCLYFRGSCCLAPLDSKIPLQLGTCSSYRPLVRNNADLWLSHLVSTGPSYPRLSTQAISLRSCKRTPQLVTAME